ncbi:capsular biosynthesis protein [Shewanella sp. A25]|nr:capsular biosynthesis protein [Shewanella shenzhenensis]
MYGDCRAYHAIAGKICKKREINFWALEEGYLRPDFVTMELDGVNANSPLYPLRANLSHYQGTTTPSATLPVGKTFGYRAWYASRYHINKFLGQISYPHFVDHRLWSLTQEIGSWFKGGLIKLTHQQRDKLLLSRLAAHSGKLFLLPLQVSDDFQIRHHSNYRDMASVIDEVVTSFARFANEDDILLIKHHPMDRGYIDYAPQITELSARLGLANRLHYGYQLPLPQVYPLLKGVVTVNSTVGFSALLHEVPVKCLGKALYDINNLTSSCTLSQFWQSPQPVNMDVFKQVKLALKQLTQLNGSYYKAMPFTAQRVAERVILADKPTELSRAS